MAEERISRIMNAVASLYSELKSIREGANWDRKLLAASYLDHRTDYEGTEVEKRTVYDSSAKTYFQVFHDGFLGYLMPEDDVWACRLRPTSRTGKGRGSSLRWRLLMG